MAFLPLNYTVCRWGCISRKLCLYSLEGSVNQPSLADERPTEYMVGIMLGVCLDFDANKISGIMNSI